MIDSNGGSQAAAATKQRYKQIYSGDKVGTARGGIAADEVIASANMPPAD